MFLISKVAFHEITDSVVDQHIRIVVVVQLAFRQPLKSANGQTIHLTLDIHKMQIQRILHAMQRILNNVYHL